ncbi:dienelactone hydrolase family protein [Brevibacterium daeguense]|uniref:Dienelactone hydrolase family protein n=1 Tax=Brevibacterium daeguense TaxID=909936 RepID=A0ABP8EHU0_9MICO|nr:dienelactone hydrolase family protein [Brevibacterium daeguense]
MATVVLFHSAIGLNDGIHAMAQVLSDAGHRVHTPDYYDGHVFDATSDGIRYRDEVGFPTLAKRASAAIEGLPGPLVFGGFSLGAAMAQSMGKRDPRAAGSLLFHAGGVAQKTSWNSSVPLQIHHSQGDPWIEAGHPEKLVASVAEAGAPASLFVYPGSGHLFADPTHAEYEPQLAELMWSRVLSFLEHEATRPQASPDA